MRYSALVEDISKIKDIQTEYTNQLNSILRDYSTAIEEWANLIGCELINETMRFSTDYIIDSYTRAMIKIRDNSDSDTISFEKVSDYCCASDVSKKDTKELQNFIFACMLTLNSYEMKLISKEEFEIDDNRIEEFKNIASMYYGKFNYLCDDIINRIKVAETENILVKPLDFYMQTSNNIILNFFKDQNNIYHKYLAWLNQNKNKMKQITEDYIAQNKNNNGNEFINNQFGVAVKEMSGLPPAISNTNINNNLNNNDNDNSKDNGKNKKEGKRKEIANKIAKTATKIGETLESIADKYSPEVSLKIGDATIKQKKPSILGIVGTALKGIGNSAQVWTDGSDKANSKTDANETTKQNKSNEQIAKQISDANETTKQNKTNGSDINSTKRVNKIDVLDNLNKEITKELNLNEYNSNSSSVSNINYEKFNEKIGTIIYNNPSYQQVLGLSDDKLVKMGLADDYKKITGRDISQTPISFSPYMYNGSNNSFPELKVKNNQINDLNEKIDKCSELSKINFDKIISEISEIKNKKNEHEKRIMNGEKEPYDGLAPISRGSEVNKLTDAITGLTNSINTPNLLANKDGKYNGETLSSLFEAIEKSNNNLNDAVKIFTNKEYGYSGYKDNTFDVNNYEDLNYALKNKMKFRPNRIYNQKLAKAKDFGSDTNNSNILSLLKGAVKGIVNIGVTLALSAVSLPAGVIYGIGSMAATVATSPRDEYKDMLDNLGEETVDSFINNFEYNDEKNEYNCIN